MLASYHSYMLTGFLALAGMAWFLLPYMLRTVQARRLAGLCRKHRLVVLSFDDGPSESLTPRVADLLRKLGIRASFFLIGERALLHPTIVNRVTAEGHEIGSHTARHLNAWKSMPVAHCRDMLLGHRLVERVAGQTLLFRPPYGKMSLASLVLAKLNRMSLAWWTIDSQDSLARPFSHEHVLNQITSAGGGVVLLHDHDRFPDPRHDEYVLTLIAKIAGLAAREGLRFGTFSALYEQGSGSVDAEKRHGQCTFGRHGTGRRHLLSD